LSDFLSDGLRVAKKGLGNIVVFSFTFIPPLAIVLFYPDAFMRGLSYAGISVLILMVLLPPLMVWRGRYHHELATDNFQVRGGKLLLALLVVFATLMIGFGFEGVI
jgi:tyrosine-specific transport protein